MNWIQTKLPDLPIHNFTTDWNDGKAVGALVDAVAPGLCPDWPVNNTTPQPKPRVINIFPRIGIQKIQSKMHLKLWDLPTTG